MLSWWPRLVKLAEPTRTSWPGARARGPEESALPTQPAAGPDYFRCLRRRQTSTAPASSKTTNAPAATREPTTHVRACGPQDGGSSHSTHVSSSG